MGAAHRCTTVAPLLCRFAKWAIARPKDLQLTGPHYTESAFAHLSCLLSVPSGDDGQLTIAKDDLPIEVHTTASISRSQSKIKKITMAIKKGHFVKRVSNAQHLSTPDCSIWQEL